MTAMTAKSIPARRTAFGRTLRTHGALYLMLAPGVLYYLLFRYVPMYGITIAFKDFNIFEGILGSPWAGFKHFEALFRNPQFARIMQNTLIISLLKLIVSMPADIILALLINELRIRWFKKSVQTITYLPHFLSWVMIYGILLAFLSPGSGLINQWITGAGGKPIPFLTDNNWFRAILVFSEVWKDTGWGAIIYLAALAGISPELYEASRVDGANKWQQVRHITLPGITGVIVLVLVLRLGYILNAGFEQVYILYNPRVYAAADIIDTWVFRNGIEQFRFSIATAAGLFKSVIGLAMVLIANKLAKRWTDSGIW
jgi:putative aldouronate transport system permease protein